MMIISLFLITLLIVCKDVCGQTPTEHVSYTEISNDLELQNVVVIVRHGDRSQITRELGEAFYESNNLTHFWRTRLPSEKTLRSLVMHQRLSRVFTLEELRKKLYAGWDFAHLPYGQLTEIGSGQLVAVGEEMRRRYIRKIFPSQLLNSSEYIHCRSTNLCRTILSARSFLAGFLFPRDDNSNAAKVRLPLIFSRLKTEETMYPHADGPCWAMTNRRYALIKQLFQSPSARYPVPSYVPALENRLKDALGITGKSQAKAHLNWMTWLNLMEIMICFQAHNISLPKGVSNLDVNLTIDFVTWKWGVLYQDVELVQFAVGRFIHELIGDILSITREFRISHRSNFSQHHASNADNSFRSTQGSAEKSSWSRLGPHTSQKRYLRSEQDLNRQLAHSSSQSSPEKLEEDNAQYTIHSGTAFDGNIFSSTPAKGNAANFLNPVPNIPPPLLSTKLLLYAGHDATLVPLLVVLGIYRDRWPEYGAHLTFEFSSINSPHGNLSLHSNGNNLTQHHRLVHPQHGSTKQLNPIHFPKAQGFVPDTDNQPISSKLVVRVVYNNEAVMIPKCGVMWCPFPSFMDILKPYSMSHRDYTARCHNENIV